MASQFQNRLIGTIVLVALSVIILPVLLDGKKKYYENEFSAIPLMPEFANSPNDMLPVDEPLSVLPQQKTGKTPQQIAPVNNVHVPAVSRNKSESTIAAMPEIKPSQANPEREKAPVAHAWVVQLGAFKNATRVNDIAATLRQSGYKAFTVPVVPVQGKITRLYIGPDASKKKLQSLLADVNSLSGLDGQIKAYTVGSE